jgi:hypothetical protein
VSNVALRAHRIDSQSFHLSGWSANIGQAIAAAGFLDGASRRSK